MNDYINKYISSDYLVLCGKKGEKLMPQYIMIIPVNHTTILEMNGSFFASTTTSKLEI
jgi:hypothetical protein